MSKLSADRQLLTNLFEAAIAAAEPTKALRGALPAKPKGRTIVVGAGKGAAQLGAAFEDLWDGPFEGVIVTRYGYAAPCRTLRVMEAAHPVPDEAGLKASRALLEAVSGLTEDDLVIALVTGGGSALLPMPAGDLTLADEKDLNAVLLASGAPISVMNRIRRLASGIKAGRLAAAAYPAKVVTLVVSDVPGDDPAEVASGPTVPSPGGVDEVMGLIEGLRLSVPERVLAHLQSPEAAAPDPRDPVFAKNEVNVIASARMSLEAAAAAAKDAGLPAVILSDAIEGEARDVGQVHAAIAREVASRGRPFQAPTVVLSGGETTVTLDGSGGRGGRNTEFLLAFAKSIDGTDGITALAADTDGIDGSEDNAGAFCDGQTCARMRAAGVDPEAALFGHDAWGAFDASGDLFVPGPTGTNVNDFRAILIRN